ncbi:hypothetical protein [Methylocystis parvus]|uniref:hypothetical protein n=1 Tax=Methylocystis parvus TaxID=134 RepID=UPI003C72AD88
MKKSYSPFSLSEATFPQPTKGRKLPDYKNVSLSCSEAMSGRRGQLLTTYLLNRKLGAANVRRLIRDDIRRLSEMGAKQYASDLADVLKCFDSAFPNAS